MEKLALILFTIIFLGVQMVFTLEDLPLNPKKTDQHLRPRLEDAIINLDIKRLKDVLAQFAINITDRVSQADKICYQKTGIVNDKWKNNPVDLTKITNIEKCYLTCFFYELGMITNNNKFRANSLFLGFPREIFKLNGRIARAINYMVASCNKMVNSKKDYKECEMGPAIIECFQMHTQKVKAKIIGE